MIITNKISSVFVRVFLIILIILIYNNKITDEKSTKSKINNINTDIFNNTKKNLNHSSNSKRPQKISKTETRHAFNNYKLYNHSENPFVTFVFNFSDIYSYNLSLFNNYQVIFKKSFIDTQIIFINNSSIDCLKNRDIDDFIKERSIELFEFKSKIYKKRFSELIKKIKGRFFILFDKIIEFHKENFFKIYKIAKGSIQNIFKLDYQPNYSFYLIRTKILKDIIDSEKIFNNYNEIINLIYSESNPKFNYIPIAYCPNNYYTSLVYTSMISVLDTRQIYTYILFYLIITLDFEQKNIEFIESLYEQFDYFNITFIRMDNRYDKAYSSRYITKNAFYRLSLGELLPNLNKVIYLDSDTICLKDLNNLYNLNFLGKIFLAKLNTFDNGGLNFTVNTGVLLLNLYDMRKKKIEQKVLTILNNGFKHPVFHDQAIINIYFKKYIGFLPTEYNTFSFNYDYLKQYKKDTGELYDFDSLYFSFKFASIIHLRGDPKMKTYNEENWYYFARKSKYFQKRSQNYSNIFNFSIYK